MYNGKKILAIIPARGGSKGIRNKNIVNLCGKPLIAYTIEEALKCKYIDRVIVSTDDMKIKEVSEKQGVEVPFIRPEELSDDRAKSIDVVLHCIDFLEKVGEEYDYVILLQPTSPLRESFHIKEAIEKLFYCKADSLISVCEVDDNPMLMRTIEHGKLKEILECHQENLRRQELPVYYKLNGAIYINSVLSLVKDKGFINSDTIPYIMEKNKSIDIDEPIDLIIAEKFIKGDVL